MKVTVEGFIVAKQYDWDEKPSFSWSAYDPTEWDKECAIVGPHTIEFDIPEDFDIRPVRIATLTRQKEALQAKVAAEVAKIDDQIQKLLALPSPKEA